MYGFNAFTLLLCFLAVTPVLLVLRIIAMEMRRKNVALAGGYTISLQAESTPEPSTTADAYAFERTHRHLTSTARCEVDRPLNVTVSQFAGDAVSKSYNANSFEYTIKRHSGAVRQEALDMGGFSQVPLLLYDKTGNCFTVHRRLSLN